MKRTLMSRNFTLLIAGQASSLFANCILDLALSMYVLEVTGSAAVFAGFLAASMLPTILLSPLGGALADRLDRRKMMVCLDMASGLVLLAAAVLLQRGHGLPVVAAVLLILSALGAFESPTVQACIPQIHSGDDLLRANAAVNQVAALSTLVGPFAGSALYALLGLEPVLYAGACCFLVTALLECLIRLPPVERADGGAVLRGIGRELAGTLRFMRRDQPVLARTLVLTAVAAFFVQGTALVGLPYLVRQTLGLGAEWYGAAESLLGLAGVAGSAIAGASAAGARPGRLGGLILGMGLSLLPAGAVFLAPAGSVPRYGVLLACFGALQVMASIFSVQALSLLQRLTPEHTTGKLMAYAATVTLCAQPAGQLLYGAAFDLCAGAAHAVLLPTAAVLGAIGLAAGRRLDKPEI